MASLWKHPNSKFWTACYTDREGRQMKRSTKQTDKRKALLIAVEYERIEAQARSAGVSTRQMQRVLNDMLEKTNQEAIVTPTTEKYLRDWLTSIETKKSAGTFERYQHTVDLFLEHLGASARSPITSISGSHIEGFLDARLKDGVATKTASVDIKTLNVAFNRAERYSVILKNPVTAVELPKVESSEREMFSPDQVKKLLEVVGYKSDWFTLILLGYYTGQRLGDCATLTWKNVDFKERVIFYQQKKTGKKVRSPMVEDLYDHLHFNREFIEGEYVCPALAKRSGGGAHGLSESFKAGGVGGLLLVNTTGTNCFTAYDGNGNIDMLVNCVDKSLVARYEYNPSGQLVRQTGTMSKINHFTFASKYQDGESQLLYFGNRYYSPYYGRWISRDSAEESGGANLYAHCYNDPINYFDTYGNMEYKEVSDLEKHVRQLLDISLDMDKWNPIFSPNSYALMVDWFKGGGDYDFGPKSTDQYDVGGGVLSASQFGNYLAGYAGGYAFMQSGDANFIEGVYGVGAFYGTADIYADTTSRGTGGDRVGFVAGIRGYIDSINMQTQGIVQGVSDSLFGDDE